jgi:hypothetical protein
LSGRHTYLPAVRRRGRVRAETELDADVIRWQYTITYRIGGEYLIMAMKKAKKKTAKKAAPKKK